MTRVAWGTLCFVAVIATCAYARAQTPPVDPPADAPAEAAGPPPNAIAGIAVGPADVAVLDQLDAMLGRPTVRYPANGARSRDDYVVLATSLTERFVVVIDVRRSRVYAFEPRDQRVVDRAIARDVVRSPYAVAGIAFELLELIGFESAPPPPDPIEPPPDPIEPPPDPIEPPPSSSGVPEAQSVLDGIELGVGGRAILGLTDEPRFIQLSAGVDVVFAPWSSRRRLVIGVFGSALGEEHASSEQGMSTGELTYRRTDLGVRVGLGRRMTDHFALAGFVRAGAGLGAIDLVRTTNGMSDPSTARDRWAAGVLGLEVDVRVPILRGFSLVVNTSLDTLLVAHDYSGAAGSEFHESPVRLTLSATFGWGTSSLGR